ncbi:MAG: ATP-dependent DNA helicase, partial [Chitinivibrionales bacterium]
SGRVPVFENRDDDNCFFIEREKHSDIISVLKELVMNRIPRKYSADPLRDIQILSPVHSGDIGTASVNRVFQKEFYLSGNHIDSGGYRYFEGDKILQSVNNYDKRVFNGDIGYIESILKDNVVVDYDGVSVKYTRPELKEIVPAHCITVHKSQGCEFDHVIMVLSTSHYIMLKRNILYTGLTRAKTSCIIIGSLRALKICIKNNSVASRYSNLDQRLNTEKPSFNNKCYYKG